MPEYCDYCVKLVWPNGDPEDWEVTWESASWAAIEDFVSQGSMRALVSSSATIFVSLVLFLNFEHSIIYVLLCNIRIHVITLYSDHVCDVLCINASVLTTRMDPG
jgi:hypothetical protein